MRWLIVLATFLLSVLLYVDRVCISVAKDAVSNDLRLSETQMGWVFSAFALGYALLQTPSGWLADRLGPRRVLALIVTAWSVFTGLTAAAGGFVSLLVIRFLFGAGEAGAFPAVARAVYSWIPMNERGLVQGVNFSGSRIGAALTLPLISLFITGLGWRTTFVVLMLIGFGWAVLWFLMFRDDPTQAGWLGNAERDYILQNRQQQSPIDFPLEDRSESNNIGINNSVRPNSRFAAVLFRSPTMLALCMQYFASNFVFFFALTWFFPQLKERYELTGLQASLFAAAPLFCGAVGNWVSGWWVDRLFRSGQWVRSRRLPAMTGFLLAGIGIIGSAHAGGPLSASIWFSLCIFGADMTLSPSWSTCVDVGKHRAGVVSGTMNMAGNMGSFLTSLAFPYLLAWTSSPRPFFYIAGALNLSAIALWLLINPSRPLENSQ
ncbi:MAG TPA: MFS transporter [Pirellulaceae bacterium]|nr:MFS transporter [Pirellulaceae bacterium]